MGSEHATNHSMFGNSYKRQISVNATKIDTLSKINNIFYRLFMCSCSGNDHCFVTRKMSFVVRFIGTSQNSFALRQLLNNVNQQLRHIYAPHRERPKSDNVSDIYMSPR